MKAVRARECEGREKGSPAECSGKRNERATVRDLRKGATVEDCCEVLLSAFPRERERDGRDGTYISRVQKEYFDVASADAFQGVYMGGMTDGADDDEAGGL